MNAQMDTVASPAEFMSVFEEFAAPSWNGWRGILGRITPDTREFYAIAGRGSGKSRVVAVIASCFAVRPYHTAPGERIYVGVFGPDKKQSRVTFRYVVGLLKSVPELAALIVAETRDSVELSNGLTVEVLTANSASPRGRSYALVIIEEAAFLPTDTSANPDLELVRAIRPALARCPGSLLCVVSSPYSRRGILYEAFRKYHGQPDGRVVLVQADTLTLNPLFDAEAVSQAYEDDPASAAAEYGAQFRSDIESFISRAAVDAVTMPGRFELPRVAGVRYQGFIDAAGGSKSGGDSFTLAIAHLEGRKVILDCVRETKPPFSPEGVCSDYAMVLKSYGVTTATADRWAGQFVPEAFRKAGVIVKPSEKAKSDIYIDFLPMVNSGSVELLDHPRSLAQLCALERRTHRGGRDNVDHGPGQHDDAVNAVAGACVLANLSQRVARAGVF